MKNAERTASPDPSPEAVGDARSGDSRKEFPEFDWEAVLGSISSGLYSPPSWLSSVKVRSVEGKSVCLETENQFQADWAKNHYLGLIREEAGKIYGRGLFDVEIVAGENAPRGKRAGNGRREANGAGRDGDFPQTAEFSHSINAGNTFGNFIVSPATSSPTPRPWRSPKDRDSPTTRFSSTASPVSGRPTCSTP